LIWFLSVAGLLISFIWMCKLKTIKSSIMNMTLGCATMLGSIILVPKIASQEMFILVTFIELVGAVGIFLGLLYLWDALSVVSIVAIYSIGIISLLLSSFTTPSQGYLFLILGISAKLLCIRIILQRQRITPSSPHMMRLPTVIVTLISCGLMYASSPFGNIFLLWIGLASVIFCLLKLISDLSYASLLSSLVLSCTAVMITAVFLQSEVVLMTGFLSVFISMIVLAISVFPKSMTFPSILTCCGVVFFYIGTHHQQGHFFSLLELWKINLLESWNLFNVW